MEFRIVPCVTLAASWPWQLAEDVGDESAGWVRAIPRDWPSSRFGRNTMNESRQGGGHSAADAALGFYYQAFFALLTLLGQNTDNAAVGIEQLDDVELKADGHTLFYQLKHSMASDPPAISLKSVSLWRTMKAWIDILSTVALSETTFHLVAVSGISSDSPLNALSDSDAD